MTFPSPAIAAQLALLLTVTAGCQADRTARTSAEYEQAHARWSRLLERHSDFDEAALDPDFAEVIALLDAAPDDWLARDFREQLHAIRERAEQAQRERLARQERMRYRPEVSAALDTASREALPRAAAQEGPPAMPTPGHAEPQLPIPGMSTALFKERFGDCFAFASALEVTDLGQQGEVWRLAERDACRARLPGFADKSVLLVDDKIESVRPTASLHVVEKIFFEGREISPQERDCLEENHRRALARQAPLDCQNQPIDPYQAPAQVPSTASIVSL